MTALTLLQIIAACFGTIGSLFFAQGVMRQSISNMAAVSGTYWDFNPQMVASVAAQKADYLFGGSMIVVAFATQLSSFLVASDLFLISTESAWRIPWLGLGCTIVMYLLLRNVAKKVASRFEDQIRAEIAARRAMAQQSREARHGSAKDDA